MNEKIESVEMFKVGKKTFETRDDAEKYIFQLKKDKVMRFTDGNTVQLLEEMLKQGISNKNKILNLIKEIKKNDELLVQ